MAILCYISDRFRKDATSHGIPNEKLESLIADVEKRQSLSGFDHFPPPCLTKKKWAAYNNRVVAVEKLVNGHVVVIPLRLVTRGGNDYAAFNRNPPAWAAKFFDEEFDDDKLHTWVVERTEKSPPPAAPLLSASEQTFLWSVAYEDVGDDVMVCESHEWEDSTNGPRIQDRRVLIPEMILSVLDGTEGVVQTIRSSKDERLSIQAIRFDKTSQCLLIRAYYGATDDDHNATSQKWQNILAAADTETVLRHSRRSYPWVCCDDNIWMEIQKDPQANLALSPEEAEILQLTTAKTSTEPALPLFINGRAGSGKSTLLQYLFAQSFIRWGRSFTPDAAADTCPIYFASSGELLAVACDVIDSLLNAHHQHLLSSGKGDQMFLGNLPGCFQEFLRYMHKQLPEEHQTRFDWSNYVTYARFRRNWMTKFGHDRTALQKYGPQISWHIIRGLIKGMSVDGSLSRDDFDDLPEDERTVSRDIYETVYDRVWIAWYEPECRSGKAWDSQDLVRLLLDEDCLKATHCAVFCDEAQDFTRLELEAIYRCSLFSNRQIDFQGVRRVPFVFAGDPFQTLNPTGFRWETVKAAFTERILRSLYRFNSRDEVPQLSYRELTFNYRSSLRLVHFCNSIQATRASLFDHRSLRPQSTWQLGQDSSPPAFFEKGDPQLEQALRDQSDLVLIVPCEEGEEIEFVERDTYLKQFVEFDEAGTPRNVLSAARSKGLEFLRVALYGWSQRSEAALLSSILQSSSERALSVDEKLALGYFLNNLYVAASRARKRLFIVDDSEALKGLWWFATDESHLSKAIQRFSKKDVWDGHVGFLVRGLPENFSADRDDPKAMAQRFEREGLSKEDSYLLRNAGQLYGNVGETAKKNECRARADLFENKFSEAAKEFELAGLIEDSLDALWKGKLYPEVVSLAGRCSEIARHPCSRMSTFLCGKEQTVRGCTTLCESLLSNASVNEELRRGLKDSYWAAAVNQALEKAVENTKGIRSEDASILADKVAELRSSGVSLNLPSLAKLLFHGKRYDEVLSLLKVDDGSEVYRYSRALALIARESEGRGQIQASEAKLIADHYMHLQEVVKAASFYGRCGDTEKLLECLRLTANEGNSSVIRYMIQDSIEAIINGGQWSLLISLISEGDPRPSKGSRWSKTASANVVARIRSDRMLLRDVVPRLAVSDKLAKSDVKSQNEVSEFLAELFVRSDAIAEWWRELPREVAGAAIERAGKDIDALSFYERWRDFASTPIHKRYAEHRWVVCKLRQARREAASGNVGKAANYRRAVEQLMEKYEWTERDVVDVFPDIQSLLKVPDSATVNQTGTDGNKRTPETAIQSEGRVGTVTYRVFPARGRINLQSDDGLCARVSLAERQVTSDEVTIICEANSEYYCDEWKLRVQWPAAFVVRLTDGITSCDICFGGERQ